MISIFRDTGRAVAETFSEMASRDESSSVVGDEDDDGREWAAGLSVAAAAVSRSSASRPYATDQSVETHFIVVKVVIRVGKVPPRRRRARSEVRYAGAEATEAEGFRLGWVPIGGRALSA